MFSRWSWCGGSSQWKNTTKSINENNVLASALNVEKLYIILKRVKRFSLPHEITQIKKTPERCLRLTASKWLFITPKRRNRIKQNLVKKSEKNVLNHSILVCWGEIEHWLRVTHFVVCSLCVLFCHRTARRAFSKASNNINAKSKTNCCAHNKFRQYLRARDSFDRDSETRRPFLCLHGAAKPICRLVREVCFFFCFFYSLSKC